jgi:diguanylate cyclase (GGDEF)-like protein
MMLLGFGVSVMLTLAVALYLLSRTTARLRRLASAGIMALNEAPGGIILTTDHPDVVLCNQRLVDLLGLETPDGYYADLDGLPLSYSLAANPCLAPLCAELIDASLVTTIDRDDRPLRLRRRVIQQLVDGHPVTTIALHEAEPDAAENSLEPNASGFRDDLTGLATRALFQDRTTQALEGAARAESGIAVIALEIDQFDAFLHERGPQAARRLIREVAARLASTSRDMDTVARIDRNRFAILLPNASSAAVASLVAHRFVGVAAFRHDEGPSGGIEITASAGIALSDRRGVTHFELVKRAAGACRNARRAGGNRALLYTPSRDEQLPLDQTIVEEIRAGLESEFYLEYQPIISLETMHPVAFEALLRWQHPVRGLVAPADFIPQAERSGLILELGKQVLDQACADAAQWPYDVNLFVNVSIVQLLSSQFRDQVLRALAKAGLSPDRLMLEITESMAANNLQRLGTATRELQALGVGVVLDDFGTGQSNLSHLRTLSFNGLKIDRQFVADLARPRSREVIAMLIYYCRQQGLQLIAEGVETEEQAAMLKKLGCTYAQGYCFGRPGPASAASDAAYAHLTVT